MRTSNLPWLLALALAACARDSGSSGLALREISVADRGSWQANRPIEFVFDQRIDFASVSERSIRIRSAGNVPAAGTFAFEAIDADGDGLEETDERVVVFHPRCALSEDLSDSGFVPGVRYVITLAGADSGEDPATLVRSVSGSVLASTVVRAFETIADPLLTLHDELPGAPPRPLLRAPGASAGPGSRLELGGDPASAVYFEPGPVSARPPSGFAAPLNLHADPATHVAFVLVFDQSVRPAAANLARLSLEYSSVLAPSGWRALETRAELLSNCHPGEVRVRLVPLGTFPPRGFVRAGIAAGFEDVAGEATTESLAGFAVTEVVPVAYASLAPAGAIADEIREEFDFGPESARSLADPAEPAGVAPARWGEGELRANLDPVVIPPELREFDWVVERGLRGFDTTATAIEGGPGGAHVMVQETVGGFVAVRHLVVETDALLRVIGPNPLVIQASGNVTILGTIDASGAHAPNIPLLGMGTGAGGEGFAGGGAGGSGSGGATPRGASGSAAFEAGPGGQGGESGFAPESRGEAARRGAGGGGGRFARDQGALKAERGGDGALGGSGAESGSSPARGGAAGPDVFVDGDPTNDFLGFQPVVDASGTVVAKRRGELDRVHAGMGGGSAGDSIASGVFPPPALPGLVLEGGGGGGGGGALVIRARGTISFGPAGRIRASGGNGGRRGAGFRDAGGACGGSGSGGHVILEAGTAIDFAAGDPGAAVGIRIEALGGPRINPATADRGFGGAGGPGVVQLHVPHPERTPGDPGSNLILPLAALSEPSPLAAVCRPRPVVLYPSLGSLSRGRSRWIPLGAAGEEAPGRPASVVGLSFAGLETAPGEDHGKVLTSDGRVLQLAPLLGPLDLAQPGIELLADGASLALSGAVLAPLRASAEPISPDVYLRTPALLEGCTLRLANAADPSRRNDLTIAAARYDDAAAVLTLAAGGLAGTLAGAVAELGGADAVALALVPRSFRVRLGPGGTDLLPASHAVRILFQGAADDGTGRPDEANPLVDWTADVSAFGGLPPGALDFLRFQVEFELDPGESGFDPEAEPLALEFLRLPLRF